MTTEEKLVQACATALSAFRNLYKELEYGDEEDLERVMNDESYWPLSDLREALEEAGMSEEAIADL